MNIANKGSQRKPRRRKKSEKMPYPSTPEARRSDVFHFKNLSIAYSPVSRKSLLIFALFILSLFIFLLSVKMNRKVAPKREAISSFGPIHYTEWDHLTLIMQKAGHDAWKMNQVIIFFKHVTPLVLKESLKTGVPPAAVLAMAALESGYDTGYIANVTGNILALNARANDPVLPPLNVPVDQNNNVIIDKQKLKNILAIGRPVEMQDRPPSLKKDYRPEEIAGTVKQLDYFNHHPQAKYRAWHKNIIDFLYGRINPQSKIKVYVEAFRFCQEIKTSQSLNRLISDTAASRFLFLVGGKPQSFNMRPSWREKCIGLMTRLGLNSFLKEYLALYGDSNALREWRWDSGEPERSL